MGYIGANEPAFIEEGTITNSDLAATDQYRLKGRVSSGSGAPEDLTPDQGITLLNQASTQALDAARVNSYYRTLRVNGGSDLTRRLRINYLNGSGISISGADDATDGESDVTIALAAIDNNRVLGNVSGSGAAPVALDSDGLFGVINSTGTAQLANNRLAPLSPSPAGTYVKADITVDAQGRITSVNSGSLITNADISSTAEIAVSKLADGAARQLLQTDAAGTGVEWTSNVDLPGTLDVTGAATFDSTATAASFIPTSSTVPTNGVYLPAANSVAISTNGTGRLFVDSAGKVGVGEPIAQASLHVAANFSDATAITWANSQFSVATPIPGNSTANRSTIYFAPYGSDNNYAPSAISCTAGTSGASTLRFFTNPSGNLTGDISSYERLRIDSAGQIEAGSLGTAAAPVWSFLSDPNTGIYSPGADQVAISTGGSGRLFVDASGRVGINTASPQNSLVVSNGGAEGLEIVPSASGSPTLIAFNRGTSAYAPLTLNGSEQILQTSGSERLRITSAGLVGIGTSSPDYTLDVNGNAHVTSQLNVWGGTIGQPQTVLEPDRLYAVSAGIGPSSLLLNPIGGNVGIGTTSPQNQFVVSNGGAAGIEIAPTGFSGNSVITAYNRSGAAYTQLTLDGANTVFAISGTERARIDSSGRLLVGTSTTVNANRILQAAGTGAELIYNANDAVGPTLNLSKSRGALATPFVISGSDVLGNVDFSGYDGLSYKVGARIHAIIDDAPGNNDLPGRLVFSTTADGASSPTARTTITSKGALKHSTTGTYIGATTTYSEISNFGNTSGDVALFVGLGSNTNDTSSYFFICNQIGIANRMVVYGNGNVANTNNSYGSLSDVKLKENIVDATSQWSDIKALQVRKYNFKEGTGQSTHTQIGLVAQEVESVSPGLVYESPDRDAEGNDLGTVTKSVNYSVLYMKAVKALQEAMERIETLEAKVAALEAA